VLDGGPLPLGDERGRRVLDAQVAKEARRVSGYRDEVTPDPPGNDKPAIVILTELAQPDDSVAYRTEVIAPQPDGGEWGDWLPVGTALHVERRLSGERAVGHDMAPTILTQIATIPHTMRENTANPVAAMMT